MAGKGTSVSPYVYAMMNAAANTANAVNAQRSARDLANAAKSTVAAINSQNGTGTASKGAATTANNTSNAGGSFIFNSNPSSDYSNMYNKYSDRVTADYNRRVAEETARRDEFLKGLLQTRDSGLDTLRKNYDASRNQMGISYGNSQADTNAGYDNSARQNYINYMQAQKNLPDQLNALGIRGGASESSLIRLGSNYGTNVANNESARQTALRDLERQYKANLFEAEQDYNKQVAAINDTYSNDYKSYMDSFGKLLSQLGAEKSTKLLDAEQTALENDYKARKEAEAKDLEQFAGYIDGLYNNVDDYKSLIQKLKASKDPNKATKIGLARKAMNALAEKQAEEAAARATSSGGGYRSYGGGGGGYYNNNSSYDDEDTTPTFRSGGSSLAEVQAGRDAAIRNSYAANQANNSTTTTKKTYPTYYTGTMVRYGRR